MSTRRLAVRNLSETKPYERWKAFLAQKGGQVISDAELTSFDHLSGGRVLHRIKRSATYMSQNQQDKQCKYGKYRDGSAVKCIRNVSHKAVSNPDKRKQNGNQYGRKTVRRSARLAKK